MREIYVDIALVKIAYALSIRRDNEILFTIMENGFL